MRCCHVWVRRLEYGHGPLEITEGRHGATSSWFRFSSWADMAAQLRYKAEVIWLDLSPPHERTLNLSLNMASSSSPSSSETSMNSTGSTGAGLFRPQVLALVAVRLSSLEADSYLLPSPNPWFGIPCLSRSSIYPMITQGSTGISCRRRVTRRSELRR